MLPACFSPPSRKVRLASPLYKGDLTLPSAGRSAPAGGPMVHRHLESAVPVHIGRSGQLRARPSKVTGHRVRCLGRPGTANNTMANVSAKDKIRFVIALTLDCLTLVSFLQRPFPLLSPLFSAEPHLCPISQKEAMYHLSYSDVNKASIHTFLETSSKFLLHQGLPPFSQSSQRQRGGRGGCRALPLLFSCLTQPMACP